jgi:hypothetical protein
MTSARLGTAVPTWTRLLALALSTGALAAGCADATQAALNDEWQQTARCSAYYSLRAESVQGSRTAADRRTADTARADAALTYRYSHELGRLGGHALTDTDTALRKISDDLRHTIDADLSNIGRLRTRYEDECTTIVTEGQARIEYWSAELDD